MDTHYIYIPAPTPALTFAAKKLLALGFTLVPSADEADVILLPVPTPVDCDLKLFKNHIIIGGNLANKPQNCIDLLEDANYLAQNASITAEAALGLILPKLTGSLKNSPLLMLGWGRIGKALAKKLQQLDVPVSVYARKESDRAILHALGYTLFERDDLPQYRCIVNTATAPILTEADISYVNPDCYLLELASKKYLPSDRVEHGRGLPGKCKPEASGELIAQTVAQYLQGGQ